MIALMSIIFMPILYACNGINHSDPKSVAEAALKYQDEDDYEGLISLVNPEDKNLIDRYERFQKMSEEMKQRNAANSVEPKTTKKYDYKFKSMRDGLTKNDKIVEFSYYYTDYQGGFTFNKRVEIEQADGKWYLAGMK